MIGYQKNRTKDTLPKKIFNFVVVIIIPVAVLIFWEWVVRAGHVKASLLPPPTKLWQTFCKLTLSGKLQSGLLVSFKRVVIGFFVGSFAGAIVGFLMGLFATVNRALSTFVNILRPIPTIDEFFENDKYDITFEITSFANGPAEIEAFAAGELDFASMGSMPATTGASSDYGFKIVAATDKTEHIGSFVALADSGITSIADLKGKKVGTVFGGTLHYYTGRFLETAGLTYDDVEFINSGNETPSSLRAGELDAGAIGNNVAVELANEGTATLLADTIEGVIGFSEVCISDEIIENHDGLAAILLKGYDRLYQYIDENKEDYLAYLGGLTGVETDSILETWDLAEHKVYSLEDKELLTNAEELLTWMQSQDMVANTDVTLDDIIDFSVAKEAGY